MKKLIALASLLIALTAIACQTPAEQKVVLIWATPEPAPAPTIDVERAQANEAVRIKFLEDKTVTLQKRLNAARQRNGRADACLRRVRQNKPATVCIEEYASKYWP